MDELGRRGLLGSATSVRSCSAHWNESQARDLTPGAAADSELALTLTSYLIHAIEKLPDLPLGQTPHAVAAAAAADKQESSARREPRKLGTHACRPRRSSESVGTARG